jgi:hypothetical protein
MPQTSALAIEGDPHTAAEGVVVTQRLVATGTGPASGTFSAVGALAASGTVVAGPWASLARPSEGVATLIEGTERLVTAAGEITISLRASLRPVPGTGMLTGGGTWNIAAASGEYDGARAAATLTVTATVDEAGTAILDLVLSGRTPRTPIPATPRERPVSGA